MRQALGPANLVVVSQRAQACQRRFKTDLFSLSECHWPLEVVDDSGGSTFRAAYTVKFGDTVYVLHCFQKKSTHGIATPKPDMELIRERLKAAQAHAKGETK
jgi:phage-related protein